MKIPLATVADLLEWVEDFSQNRVVDWSKIPLEVGFGKRNVPAQDATEEDLIGQAVLSGFLTGNPNLILGPVTIDGRPDCGEPLLCVNCNAEAITEIGKETTGAGKEVGPA